MMKEAIGFRERDIYIEVPCTGGVHLVPITMVELELNTGEYLTIAYSEYDSNYDSDSDNNFELWRVSKESVINNFEECTSYDKLIEWPGAEYLNKEDYTKVVEDELDKYQVLCEEDGWN